jgi:hypothetical protein
VATAGMTHPLCERVGLYLTTLYAYEVESESTSGDTPTLALPQ